MSKAFFFLNWTFAIFPIVVMCNERDLTELVAQVNLQNNVIMSSCIGCLWKAKDVYMSCKYTYARLWEMKWESSVEKTNVEVDLYDDAKLDNIKSQLPELTCDLFPFVKNMVAVVLYPTMSPYNHCLNFGF